MRSLFLCYASFLFCFWTSLTVQRWLSWDSLSFTRLALNLQLSSCLCLPSAIYNSLMSESSISPSSKRRWSSEAWKVGSVEEAWQMIRELGGLLKACCVLPSLGWGVDSFLLGSRAFPAEEGLAPKKDWYSGSQVQRTECVGSKWRDILWGWTAGFLPVLANAEAIDRTASVARDPSPASSGRAGGVATCSSSAGENGLLLDPQSVLIIFLLLK